MPVVYAMLRVLRESEYLRRPPGLKKFRGCYPARVISPVGRIPHAVSREQCRALSRRWSRTNWHLRRPGDNSTAHNVSYPSPLHGPVEFLHPNPCDDVLSTQARMRDGKDAAATTNRPRIDARALRDTTPHR